jgi:UDP-glucose:(heptosyl)LPS alpha-1,3-glucosyltransferase
MSSKASHKRLRIAVLNRHFSSRSGGAERYSTSLVEELASRHEIHVFSQSTDHDWPGVTYHRVSMPLRRPRWFNQLWFATATWWATRKGFDVVHSHENTWHGAVQTVHVLPVKHNLFHDRTGLRLFMRWLKVVTSPRLLVYLALEKLRYTPQVGRAVVLTSTSLEDIFVAAYPQAASMCSVITPGVRLHPNPQSATARANARQALGLPQERFCFLLVANDMRKKGLPVAIQALRLLPDDTVLAVVGESKQLPQFKLQAQQAGLEHRVFFLGSMDDVGPAYQAADCLVHPTLEDTFAMVVLEAMAFGLPVVVSGASYCGISTMLHDQVNALLLENPRDVSALTAALRKVCQSETLRRSLSQAARLFAARFEWSGVAREQERVYFAADQNLNS